MESTPGDREHGYDDVAEEEAYEHAQEAGDEDAGRAGTGSEPGEDQPDQAAGE